MITRFAVILIVGLAWVDGLVSAQEARPIKVGVAVMSATGGRISNGKLQRDRLIRLFKPEKKKQPVAGDVKISAVPLDASSPEELGSEARDKGCDYVLYTTVLELRTQGDPAEQPRLGGHHCRPGPARRSAGRAQNAAAILARDRAVQTRAHRRSNTAFDGIKQYGRGSRR